MAQDHDVIVIGAGISGMYQLHRLRGLGLRARVFEAAAGVGGTWYWNRYPGARFDSESWTYGYSFSDEILREWEWSEHFAAQPETLRYCNFVADKLDLRRDIEFDCRIASAVYDEADSTWEIASEDGRRARARYLITAIGPLSAPTMPAIPGVERFRGEAYHTGRWPHEAVGFAGKRVGIIGTGATAVQAVPGLGANSKELFIFQRTPSSIDVRDDWETDPEWAATLEPGWQAERRAKMFTEPPLTAIQIEKRASMTCEDKIRAQENANIDYMMRIHRRIEEIVEDPATAEALKPWYMFMCKRPCFDDEYLPAFNLPNVHLVDTHGKGITEIAKEGPVFEGRTYPLDLLIYATGFEVQKTGIYNEIRGRNGVEINETYKDGLRTLLGVHTHGYPNLFIMGGYQASFQFNLTFMLQTQGDHIAECIKYARDKGYDTIDVLPETEEWWVQEVIAHRGKTTRNQDCTPGYYNFEGEFNRRQDGNYNGGFQQYFEHMTSIRGELEKHFAFS